jgi:ribosomal protein L11 methyltransferase
MSWVSLTVDVPEQHSELTQSLMYDFGAAGLELRDSAHQTMPTVRPPAKGEAIVIAYFEQQRDATAAGQEVKNRFAGSRAVVEPVIERDWSVEWRSQIKSVTVGRLWVGPPWEKDRAPKDKVCVFVEPKMAFGTGDHPTTSLCLQAVDDFMAEYPKADVLDVGTGTGVLSFAAKKLGARRVVGVDNDEMSVVLARECAQENHLAGVELSTATLEDIDGAFDLVLANILANTLIELAPAIAPKVKRRLVLAGVLVPQAPEVTAAFVAQGLVHRANASIGEWIRLEFDAAPPSKKKATKKPAVKAKAKSKSPVRERATRKLTTGRKSRR